MLCDALTGEKSVWSGCRQVVVQQSIPERSKAMFRKTRKRLLVTGLGLAALAAPTAALAGGGSFDPNSPETHARLVAQGYIDPSPYRQSAVGAKREAVNQQLSGSFDPSSPETHARLVAQGYIDRQSSSDTAGFAAPAHESVVTVTKSQGFHWDDFGIGTGVALAAVFLLVLTLRFLSHRQDRKPGSVVTA